jgi:hypothetical protein
MRRLCAHLAVEFEEHFRVTGSDQFGVDVQVAGEARICAAIQIAQLAHAGSDALLMRNIQPRVEAKPPFRRSMARLAGNARVRFHSRGEALSRHVLQWMVADGAAGILRGIGDAERLCHAERARGAEDGVSPRVHILLFPNLALILSYSTAVAARRLARRHSSEARSRENLWRSLRGAGVQSQREHQPREQLWGNGDHARGIAAQEQKGKRDAGFGFTCYAAWQARRVVHLQSS